MCGCNGGFGGGGSGPGTFTPGWVFIDVTHTMFQVAALTQSINLWLLEAAGVIHYKILKHSVVFDGPGITDYFLSIGIAGATADLLPEYDVESNAVAATNYAEDSMEQSYNMGGTQQLIITARSVGANLNASTTGAARIALLLSKAPF